MISVKSVETTIGEFGPRQVAVDHIATVEHVGEIGHKHIQSEKRTAKAITRKVNGWRNSPNLTVVPVARENGPIFLSAQIGVTSPFGQKITSFPCLSVVQTASKIFSHFAINATLQKAQACKNLSRRAPQALGGQHSTEKNQAATDHL